MLSDGLRAQGVNGGFIGALAAKFDMVVVSCHWGVSGSSKRVDYQR